MTEPRAAQVVLLLVGPPGAGKSTIAENICTQCPNWKRISQDRLRSRGACIEACIENIRLGHSVVIDRCNFDKQQRAHWIKIANQHRLKCYALIVDTPHRVCIERAVNRLGHEGGVDCSQMPRAKVESDAYQKPKQTEGLAWIFAWSVLLSSKKHEKSKEKLCALAVVHQCNPFPQAPDLAQTCDGSVDGSAFTYADTNAEYAECTSNWSHSTGEWFLPRKRGHDGLFFSAIKAQCISGASFDRKWMEHVKDIVQPLMRVATSPGSVCSVSVSGASVSSCNTSLFSINPTHHGTQRMQERGIAKRQLQKVKKEVSRGNGEKIPTHDGKWKLIHKGMVIITDASCSHVITTYQQRYPQHGHCPGSHPPVQQGAPSAEALGVHTLGVRAAERANRRRSRHRRQEQQADNRADSRYHPHRSGSAMGGRFSGLFPRAVFLSPHAQKGGPAA
jgi:predicted kinase